MEREVLVFAVQLFNARDFAIIEPLFRLQNPDLQQ